MTITEESRYQLYKRLEGTLGSDDANTLMEHLPPVGWADVATKTDLAHLQTITHAEFATFEATMRGELDRRFGEVDRRFVGLDRRFVQMGADVDQRFAGLDQRFVQMGADVDQRFAGLDQRLLQMGAEFNHLRGEFGRLGAAAESGFAQARSDLEGLEERMGLRMDKTVAESLQRQFVQTIGSVAAMFAVWSALAVIVGQFLVR